MPDFDSFVANVGIDAMMFRVIALCRDMDDPILRMLRSFRAEWRRAEEQNIARNFRCDLDSARTIYRLCRLLKPPADWVLLSDEEAAETLNGPLCSPFASVLALHEVEAFDSSLKDVRTLEEEAEG